MGVLYASRVEGISYKVNGTLVFINAHQALPLSLFISGTRKLCARVGIT
jgi:hypothetical protein